MAAGQDALFWLSDSSIAGDPGVPDHSYDVGDVDTLHIFGRPPLGKTLQNFSINVTTSHPYVDFLDSELFVTNPTVGTTPRFQLVGDTTSSLFTLLPSDITALNQPDGIELLQGFTLISGEGVGIGPTCSSDPNCFNVNGIPTWHIGSVGFEVFDSPFFLPVAIDVHLQIGANGMTYVSPGDYNRDGTVDAADYTVWKDNYGGSGSGVDGDGNYDETVDAADYTIWKDSFGAVDGDEFVRFGSAADARYHVFSDVATTFSSDQPDAVIRIRRPFPITASLAGSGVAVPEAGTGVWTYLVVAILHFARRWR